LPEALQQKYYDPAKVAAYRQQVQAANAAAAARQAEAERQRQSAQDAMEAKLAAARRQRQQAQDAAEARLAAAQRQRENAAPNVDRETQKFIQESRDEEADHRNAMVAEQMAMKGADERPKKVLTALLAIMGLSILGVLANSLLKGED
jgi:hypothetical protein